MGTITDSVYYLPLLDVDGNVQVIRVYGVDKIAIVARTRLPPIAREIFPVIRVYICPGWRRGQGMWSCLLVWTTGSGCLPTWRIHGTRTTT